MGLGLLSWDIEATGCDLSGLEPVCTKIDDKHLTDNDVLIQHSTESLGVEVLVSPTVSTLKQCVKNLLSTSTGHKHLIHVGYTFAGSGSWILQNGTFSFNDFLEIFQQADVQSQKRCNINIHCAEVGSWNSASFAENIFAKVANVAFNPPEKVSSVPGADHLVKCLEKVLSSQALEEIMKASPLVGNIRFNRPTLYLFPAGQGDCALFGINGFNMLIDGGFNRKPCSWEFIRHLDRLDAVLVTRLCENNVCGMSTLMKRKSLNNTYPQIGYVFCNIAENNIGGPKEVFKSKDDLIISVVGEGHTFTHTLNDLKLKPHQCWRDSSVEPFVLYHKVGHGTLEMHVLSPPKDSKEMKEFLSEWSSYKETFSKINSSLKSKNLENSIPLSHSTSICAILVWRPADPKDTITRILFPGSAPQSKIFESLEKLKSLDVLKQPVVTKASLSVVAVTKSITKVEKSVSRTSVPNRKNTASPALSVSSVASRNGDIGGVKKEVKKVVKEIKKDNKDVKKEVVKKELKKESVVKEVKKTTSIPKKDVLVKKEAASKEVKKDNKDIKQTIKKESKDVKAVIDKRSELKSAPKKAESTSSVTKTVTEVKKTSTVRKSTTPVKKEISKTSTVQKTAEARKSAPSKLSEPKAAKDISNKKTAETKAVPKTKPKTATPTKVAPKTKPADVPKPGSKMTKAVAASSVVASAVAVTVAALELNEKHEEIVDVEPEVVDELKDAEIIDKSQEINVSPLPPEALSPTPSESISLTPSDTLSSAPLETVSPTPPLTNEPISIEEKEVNEIKDIEQDIPYETDVTNEETIDNTEQQVEDLDDEVNKIELEHAKLQENADPMSTSFIAAKDEETPDVEEIIMKTEAAPEQFAASNIQNAYSEEPAEIVENVEEINKEIPENVDDDIVQRKETNIDDQLAQLSMEGSFCAGMASYQQEKMELPEDLDIKTSKIEQSVDDFISQDKHDELEPKEADSDEEQIEEKSEVEVHESSKDIIEKEEFQLHESSKDMIEKEEFQLHESSKDIIEKEEFQLHESSKDIIEKEEFQLHESSVEVTEKNEPQMHESFIGEVDHHEDISHMTVDSHYETKDFVQMQQEENSHLQGSSDIGMKSDFDDKLSTSDLDNKYANEVQEKEIVEKYEDDRISPVAGSLQRDEYLQEQSHEYAEDQSHAQHDEYPSDQREEIQSMASSIDHRIGDDYDIPQNIIDDAEMQESSVDEPEEIVRKESAVSITLNDNELGVNYDDDLRRKSCTESEDDVDIQNYMTDSRKDSFDQDKLNVKHDSDSDNEDVVKSPTPHAVVDYEGHIDDEVHGFEAPKEEKSLGEDDNTAYLSEKQDLDEKDRDSAEDQEEDDDGEMIRHPTPPEMKYSEEEMRDPIGQHYITAPGLKAPVSEQPLYEESEEAGSERSISPVVEQPVFGNVGGVDFPELVTVSGGTTPSEPQSPKTGFDSKKFVSEAAVMDALSEHDCSESSTHSPLCQDGTTAFELPVSEETFQKEEMQVLSSKQDDYLQEANVQDLISKETMKFEADTKADEKALDNATATDDKFENIHSADHDAPSDEESYSQNEKSETRSEKSDGDEKSDVHHDDKSDNQHDGKSDMMDDDQAERKSDMHDDDRSDSHFDDRYDDYGGKEAGNYEFQENTRSHAFGNEQFNIEESNGYDMQYEKHEIHEEIQSSDAYSTSNAYSDLGINYETSDIHVKSYERNTPDIQGKYEMDPHDFPSDTQIPQYSDTYDESNFDSKESKIYDESHIPPVGYGNIDKTDEEIPTSVSFPSSHLNEALISENLDKNISHDERYDSYANQLPSDLDETMKLADNSESMHDHDEVMQSKDTYDITNVPEYSDTGKLHHDNEEIGITKHDEFQTVNSSAFSEGFSLTEEKFKESTDHQAISSQLTDVYDDISPQHSENFSGLENKVLTEMTEARQYETLSKFEENVHTSNVTYSESSMITNTVTDGNESNVPLPDGANYDNMNYNYISEETKYSTSEKSFEQTVTYGEERVMYGETSETSYSKVSSTLHGAENVEFDGTKHEYTTDYNYRDGMHGFEESNRISNLGEGLPHDENYDIKISSSISETRTEGGQEFGKSDVTYDDSRDGEHKLDPTPGSTFSMSNGKDHGSWSHSEFSSQQYVTETSSSVIESHSNYTTTTEQEASYIINSRFHSDSPEDNVMRSDSSPDVPPYPVNSSGHLDDMKNSVLGESQSFVPSKEEYPNINLSNVGAVPLSPNKIHNANRNHPYGESSEDEDSSSVPGTVSPYAYTNKAYAKEEEDIDGNHIYKESIAIEKTEILKEFDGNNPQTVTTHQMSYSQGYQEGEYTGETNYDFRLEEWGKPMGLPTPPDSSNKTVAKKTEKPASKTKSVMDTNGKAFSPSVASKLSSPMKKLKPKTTKESSSDPVYVDLAYVPHHGDPQYCDVEFFKKVRARYYVFSGINPSKEVLNALLEAKKSWKEDLEVTIIPTYETDTLGYWMAQNQDDLATYSIEVAPSASRCTVNLQDHETSCAAYRLEF
ncbi:microtubule-associated protein futsch [Nephila pilipes]|uniref:Microtubule-associated protein futsch n=1 Tax=Nephila pilipes TaxID=299642 RepID=A0A8X6PC91_NEPPI|nr:microtubule-associated protein futsch [Nephila pilipes]